MPKQIVIEDENNVVIDFVSENVVALDLKNMHYLGSDVSNATADPENVAQGVSFYSKDNGVLKQGKLVAYNVVEVITGKDTSKLIIQSMGGQTSDEMITARNIATAKSMDLSRIIKEGGQLATDEEYELAEAEFQALAYRIMVGE